MISRRLATLRRGTRLDIQAFSCRGNFSILSPAMSPHWHTRCQLAHPVSTAWKDLFLRDLILSPTLVQPFVVTAWAWGRFVWQKNRVTIAVHLPAPGCQHGVQQVHLAHLPEARSGSSRQMAAAHLYRSLIAHGSMPKNKRQINEESTDIPLIIK